MLVDAKANRVAASAAPERAAFALSRQRAGITPKGNVLLQAKIPRVLFAADWSKLLTTHPATQASSCVGPSPLGRPDPSALPPASWFVASELVDPLSAPPRQAGAVHERVGRVESVVGFRNGKPLRGVDESTAVTSSTPRRTSRSEAWTSRQAIQSSTPLQQAGVRRGRVAVKAPALAEAAADASTRPSSEQNRSAEAGPVLPQSFAPR